jgi:hypothetical protein
MRTKTIDYAKVKRAVANLRGDALAAVKEALGADRIRVTYKSPTSGKIIELTLK